MTPPRKARQIHQSPALWIFGGVLLLRLVVLTRLSASPFLLPSGGDTQFYNDWARRIVAGHGATALAFYGLPGYAWLLAALYRVAGYNPFLPGPLQSAADAGTAALLYLISRSVFATTGKRLAAITGFIAASGWAFFVPAQTYAAILMPTSLAVFIFWFVVWWIIRNDSARRSYAALGLGLLVGITATAVATILSLVPLLFGAMFGREKHRQSVKSGIVAAALLFLGLAAGTSPCWMHNYFVAHDHVLLSAHSGINFWIGNNPQGNGYPRLPPGLSAGQAAMLHDSITVAEKAAGHRLKRGEVSRYWSGRARDYIQQHPIAWLKLLAVKLRNLVSAFQYDDLSFITTLRANAITFPGIYFGLAASLALPGLLLAWRSARQSRWIMVAVALYGAALLPVFITERYRLPIVPGLLIFAALGLVSLWQNIRSAKYKPCLAYAAATMCAAVIVSWPQRDRALWALDPYNSGRLALEANQLDVAQKDLELAHAYVPNNAETIFALGNLELARGDANLAASLYEETLALEADHRGALNNLAVLKLNLGHGDEARALLSRSEAAEPGNAKTHYLLAQAMLEQGEREDARREIARALELAPGQAEFATLNTELNHD
ncbi:MAG: tetratricopeptide repeat protein [Verrucomicrobia bacterium]|nr:tetratricopeptide repeat protein [Verrucomicrobiota bacterium]